MRHLCYEIGTLEASPRARTLGLAQHGTESRGEDIARARTDDTGDLGTRLSLIIARTQSLISSGPSHGRHHLAATHRKIAIGALAAVETGSRRWRCCIARTSAVNRSLGGVLVLPWCAPGSCKW